MTVLADFLDGFVEAYDAAPADPAQVIRDTAKSYAENPWTGTPDFALRALEALGCVVERPANTGDHHA